VERRVLIRLPNWVGDVCMALPAVHALSQAGFQPILVGRPWAVDLLAGHSWSVSVLPRATSAAVACLRRLNCPRGLLFTNSFSSAWQFRWAGVPVLGQRGDGRRFLLTRSLARIPGQHEVEVFWRLACAWIDWCAPSHLPLAKMPPANLGLQVTAAHHEAALAALAAYVPANPRAYVVLAPLAAGTVAGRSKCWPGFAALAAYLAEQNIVTVCCPGPGEEAQARAAVPNAVCVPGLGLGAYAALCRGALLTVANDSGPMHLAAAIGAPVLGVFGPSAPNRTRPWGPGTRYLGGQGHWPRIEEVVACVRTHLAQCRAG
jgi:heptosyltransferase-2